jgi:hypothetical protein
MAGTLSKSRNCFSSLDPQFLEFLAEFWDGSNFVEQFIHSVRRSWNPRVPLRSSHRELRPIDSSMQLLVRYQSMILFSAPVNSVVSGELSFIVVHGVSPFFYICATPPRAFVPTLAPRHAPAVPAPAPPPAWSAFLSPLLPCHGERKKMEGGRRWCFAKKSLEYFKTVRREVY